MLTNLYFDRIYFGEDLFLGMPEDGEGGGTGKKVGTRQRWCGVAVLCCPFDTRCWYLLLLLLYIYPLLLLSHVYTSLVFFPAIFCCLFGTNIWIPRPLFFLACLFSVAGRGCWECVRSGGPVSGGSLGLRGEWCAEGASVLSGVAVGRERNNKKEGGRR